MKNKLTSNEEKLNILWEDYIKDHALPRMSEPKDDESTCKCHCHNNHGESGSYADSHIRCKCLPNCKHCNPRFNEPKFKIVDGAYYCAEHDAKNCAVCFSQDSKNNTNWEEEFDDRFQDIDVWFYMNPIGDPRGISGKSADGKSDVKYFIKQQRLEAKKELVKRARIESNYSEGKVFIFIDDLDDLLEEEE